jgi:phosphatidylglycerophosphate synthase
MTSPTWRTPAAASAADPAARPALSKPLEVEELVDRYLHRPLAKPLVLLLARTPITPNQVTLISGLAGVAAGVAVVAAIHHRGFLLAGAALLFASVVLDCCDGQLARLRGISSTTGAILDGMADYVVGVAVGIAGSWYTAALLGSNWYWVLGIAGIASAAVQSALFDHTKTRYIARVARGYAEREEDVGRVARERAAARAERRYWDGFLLWVYEAYSRAQHAALAIPPASDPEAYRAAHAGRMRAWTFLGIGTHFALAYLLCLLAWWWPPAIPLFFLICVSVLNLALAALVALEKRRAAA